MSFVSHQGTRQPSDLKRSNSHPNTPSQHPNIPSTSSLFLSVTHFLARFQSAESEVNYQSLTSEFRWLLLTLIQSISLLSVPSPVSSSPSRDPLKVQCFILTRKHMFAIMDRIISRIRRFLILLVLIILVLLLLVSMHLYAISRQSQCNLVSMQSCLNAISSQCNLVLMQSRSQCYLVKITMKSHKNKIK